MRIYIIISGILSIMLVLISYILNRNEMKDSKTLRYECGEEEYSDTNIYAILYYKIAVTYLVFDIETILLFPTALISYLPSFEYGVFIIIYIFIFILLLGLVLEYSNNIYD